MLDMALMNDTPAETFFYSRSSRAKTRSHSQTAHAPCTYPRADGVFLFISAVSPRSPRSRSLCHFVRRVVPLPRPSRSLCRPACSRMPNSLGRRRRDGRDVARRSGAERSSPKTAKRGSGNGRGAREPEEENRRGRGRIRRALVRSGETRERRVERKREYGERRADGRERSNAGAKPKGDGTREAENGEQSRDRAGW